MSLLGALTPLGKVAQGRRLWLASVSALTLAGAVAAGLTGCLLGEASRRLGWWQAGDWVPLVTVPFAVVLASREFGLISFPLPQRLRQTEKVWSDQFGVIGGSILWGLHIGPGFHTRIRFGGFWLLVALSVVSRDPLYGGLLFVAYWLGRTLPVWIAPRVVDTDSLGHGLLCAVAGETGVDRRVHAFGLAWSALALTLWS